MSVPDISNMNTSTAAILPLLRKVRYSNSDSDDPSKIFVSNRDPTRSFRNKSGATNGPLTSGTFFIFKIIFQFKFYLYFRFCIHPDCLCGETSGTINLLQKAFAQTCIAKYDIIRASQPAVSAALFQLFQPSTPSVSLYSAATTNVTGKLRMFSK